MDPAGPPSTPSRRSIVTGAALAVPGIVAASAAPASAAEVGPVPHLFVDSRLTWTGNPGARTFFFTITTYFADQNAVRTPYTDNTVEWYVDWFTSRREDQLSYATPDGTAGGVTDGNGRWTWVVDQAKMTDFLTVKRYNAFFPSARLDWAGEIYVFYGPMIGVRKTFG